MRPAYLFALLALVACSRSSEKAQALTLAPSSSVQASGAIPPAAIPPIPRRERIEGATSTEQLLSAFSPECLACAQKAGCLDPAQQGGGTCEGVPGQSKSGQSETAMCLKSLKCIFNTKCANAGEESECLCGAIDVVECMSGKTKPVGKCVDVFREDFGDDGKKMYDNFINPKYGAGRANQLIQCAVPSCSSCRYQ